MLHVQHGVLLRLVLGLGIGDGRQGMSAGVRVSLVMTSARSCMCSARSCMCSARSCMCVLSADAERGRI